MMLLTGILSVEQGSPTTRPTARKIEGPFKGPFVFLAECG
jgi:hypothetical protein